MINEYNKKDSERNVIYAVLKPNKTGNRIDKEMMSI